MEQLGDSKTFNETGFNVKKGALKIPVLVLNQLAKGLLGALICVVASKTQVKGLLFDDRVKGRLRVIVVAIIAI